MKKMPPIGALCKIEWDDICAYTNTDLPAAKPAPCTTWGIMKKQAPDHIIVATSIFTPESPEDTPQGDFVAIPRGCIRRVHLLQ